MDKLCVALRIQADEDGLWLEDDGRRVPLPGSFWHALAGALRDAGQPELAGRVERAHAESEERRVRAQAKFLCMDPAYSPEQARRCHELLEEDLKSG
ncbi:MAG: hypothetical protein BIP78_0784 [Candidatus Bipolaricaulis sibiricus]|uniref:Uncharacterized protein n=1 Tax=Bipolaricaulis sibiricus TaxID=2501609 RepID=A0A410FUG5_BIPS1|nr:MAG: hypothetical protein BIP78_0784 [Candidatus Bipolaricaulis sibiricus]